jgi:hypothetical protein
MTDTSTSRRQHSQARPKAMPATFHDRSSVDGETFISGWRGQPGHEVNTASNAAVNSASRSRIRNRNR